MFLLIAKLRFFSFLQVKQIEKRDSVLTPKQQIERLLRAGSTYFNLNPFEVLQVEPDTPLDEIRTKYKRLSILVHPDKNQDDKDRAQAAFEGTFIYNFQVLGSTYNLQSLFFCVYKSNSGQCCLPISAISRAWKVLENEETRAKCMDVVEEAKAKVDANVRINITDLMLQNVYFPFMSGSVFQYYYDITLDCREKEKAET